MNNIPSNHWLITKPIAHRGMFNNEKCIIENSLPAILIAVKNNHPIEIDVRMTNDREIIVFHDKNIKRLTGINKRVCDLTDEDLNTIKYLNCNSKILRLKDLLKVVDGKVPLLIELKCKNNINSLKSISFEVSQILRNYKGEYAIQSFNPLISYVYRKYSINSITGIIIPFNKKNIYFIYKILDFIFNYDFISPNIKINNSFKTDKPVIYWLIDSEEKRKKAIKNNGNYVFEKIKL